MRSIKKIYNIISNNYRGWRSDIKYLIIESDDWGAIRMPDRNTYLALLNKGIPVDKCAYCKYDTLETSEDWEALMYILHSVKNSSGDFPVFTANFVTANPDFDKIRNENFENYYYETIAQTYDRYGVGSRIINDFKSCDNFIPQFHGRDHVNVPLWLELLKSNKTFQLAFDYKLWGLSRDVFPNMKKSIQATYDSLDLNYCSDSLVSGMELFEKIFGFRSFSFISNNFTWSPEIEICLFKGGVRYMQGMKYQLLPLDDDISVRKMRRHYLGERNNFGMYFGVRNCSFEPSLNDDTISSALNQIRMAFLFRKPAVISTHRINYVSGMDSKKRDENLTSLRKLLQNVVKEWPDVQFISSNQLCIKMVNSHD